MKRIVYSIYNEIPDNALEKNQPYSGDTIPKSLRAKLQFKKHYNTLKKCKEEWAELCGAEFKIFNTNPDPKNDIFNLFKQKFGLHFGQNRKDYDIMQFFKIFVFEQMANYYDEIVYLDFDVIPNGHFSPFDYWNMSKINVLGIDSKKENIWSIHDLQQLNRNKSPHDTIVKSFDKQNMYCKMMTKKAMLATQGINGNNIVTNTGILGGNSQAIKKLNFFDDFVFKIDTLIQAKEEQMFGPVIADKGFINNEIFFAFHLENKNIPWENLTQQWHYMLMSGNLRVPRDELERAYLIHVMDKNFEKVFKICGIQQS